MEASFSEWQAAGGDPGVEMASQPHLMSLGDVAMSAGAQIRDSSCFNGKDGSSAEITERRRERCELTRRSPLGGPESLRQCFEKKTNGVVVQQRQSLHSSPSADVEMRFPP